MKKIALVLSFVLGTSVLMTPARAMASGSCYAAVGAYIIAAYLIGVDLPFLSPGAKKSLLKSFSSMPKEQREIALLSLSSKPLNLDKQAASGFHQSWKSVSGAEKKALKKDASLEQMAGF